VLLVKTFCVTFTGVIEKQQERGNRRAHKTPQKRQHKVLRVKLGDFVAISVYDLVTWVGLALCVGLILIYGFQHNQRGFWWSLVAMGILVVIMLAIRARQYFGGDEGVAQYAERPILFVERVIARPLVAGHRKAVSVWLRNSGKKPARKITVWITQAFTKADFVGPLIYKPVYEPDSRFDCEPGAAVSLAGKSESPVALWEIKALNDRKAFWFHYGQGTYEDDLGNIYPLRFCYMYEPGLGGDLRICPDRFLPKEDDAEGG
jgi:hypothetical protein